MLSYAFKPVAAERLFNRCVVGKFKKTYKSDYVSFDVFDRDTGERVTHMGLTRPCLVGDMTVTRLSVSALEKLCSGLVLTDARVKGEFCNFGKTTHMLTYFVVTDPDIGEEFMIIANLGSKVVGNDE